MLGSPCCGYYLEQSKVYTRPNSVRYAEYYCSNNKCPFSYSCQLTLIGNDIISIRERFNIKRIMLDKLINISSRKISCLIKTYDGKYRLPFDISLNNLTEEKIKTYLMLL